MAEPLPHDPFGDGAPRCQVRCPNYAAEPANGKGFPLAVCNAGTPQEVVQHNGPCLPAIRAMHTELLQLRARDPLRVCGECGAQWQDHHRDEPGRFDHQFAEPRKDTGHG